MLKFCSLFSGSSGNCLFVGDDDTRILIDAGVSGRRIEGALAEIGESCSCLSGILITHEHEDHMNIETLGAVLKNSTHMYYDPKEMDYLKEQFKQFLESTSFCNSLS